MSISSLNVISRTAVSCCQIPDELGDMDRGHSDKRRYLLNMLQSIPVDMVHHPLEVMSLIRFLKILSPVGKGDDIFLTASLRR